MTVALPHLECTLFSFEHLEVHFLALYEFYFHSWEANISKKLPSIDFQHEPIYKIIPQVLILGRGSEELDWQTVCPDLIASVFVNVHVS